MRSRVVQGSGWLPGDSDHLGFSGIRAGGRHLELSRMGEAWVYLAWRLVKSSGMCSFRYLPCPLPA